MIYSSVLGKQSWLNMFYESSDLRVVCDLKAWELKSPLLRVFPLSLIQVLFTVF